MLIYQRVYLFHLFDGMQFRDRISEYQHVNPSLHFKNNAAIRKKNEFWGDCTWMLIYRI